VTDLPAYYFDKPKPARGTALPSIVLDSSKLPGIETGTWRRMNSDDLVLLLRELDGTLFSIVLRSLGIQEPNSATEWGQLFLAWRREKMRADALEKELERYRLDKASQELRLDTREILDAVAAVEVPAIAGELARSK
jgi:hypothetical protein